MTTKSEREAVALIRRELPHVDEAQGWSLYRSAKAGGEVDQHESISAWLTERVRPSLVVLGETHYLKALVESLKLAPKLVASDYGSTRQRDLGQLWTDTARGFLGELAFVEFARNLLGVQYTPDYSIGPLDAYLPSDVVREAAPGEERGPKLSIKTTKFNGIWLDIPGAQLSHSDAFVLVKLGVSRDHFLAFLKWISFIRDKLLKLARDGGALSNEEADALYGDLPDFRPIPCYVAGFLDEELVSHPPVPAWKKKTQNRQTVACLSRYVGWVKNRRPQLSLPCNVVRFTFEGIGEFSAEDHFVCNSGALHWREEAWRKLLRG